MKKAGFLLPGLVLLLPAGGCSLFRQVGVSRQDSTYTANTQVSRDWKIDSTQIASRVFSYSDSSGAEFEVEIVPYGAFTFSPQAGFAGSASVLRLRGKAQREIRSSDSSNRQAHVQSSGSLKEKRKVKTKTTQKQKTKSGHNSLWWWLALLASGLLVFVKQRSSRS